MSFRLVEIDNSPQKAPLLRSYEDNKTITKAALCQQVPDVLVTASASGYLQVTFLSRSTYKIYLVHLDGIPLEAPLRCLELSPAALCISREPQAPIFFSVSHSNLLMIGSFATGKVDDVLAFPSRPGALFCDGDFTFCGDSSGHAALFRHEGYLPSVLWERDIHRSAIVALCVHQNVAVAAGADYSIIVVDIAKGEAVASITSEATPTASLFAFSPPSYCIGVCGAKGTITVWSPVAETMHSWVPIAAESAFPIRTAHQHNKFLAVGGIDGRVALYDASEPESLRQMAGFDLGHSVVFCDVTEDGFFVVATNGGDIWRWPVAEVVQGEEGEAQDDNEPAPEPEPQPAPRRAPPSKHQVYQECAMDDDAPAPQMPPQQMPRGPTERGGDDGYNDRDDDDDGLVEHTVELAESDDNPEGNDEFTRRERYDHDEVQQQQQHEEIPCSGKGDDNDERHQQQQHDDEEEEQRGDGEADEVIFMDDFSVPTPLDTQTISSNAPLCSRPPTSNINKEGLRDAAGVTADQPHVPTSNLSSVALAPSSVVVGGAPDDNHHALHLGAVAGGGPVVQQHQSTSSGSGSGVVAIRPVSIPGLKAGRRMDPRVARAALDRADLSQRNSHSKSSLRAHELATVEDHTSTIIHNQNEAAAANEQFDFARYAAQHRSETLALAFRHPVHAVHYKNDDVVFNVVGLTSPMRIADEPYHSPSPNRDGQHQQQQQSVERREANNNNSVTTAGREQQQPVLDELMDATFLRFVRKRDENYVKAISQPGPSLEDHFCDPLLFPQSTVGGTVFFAEYKPKSAAPNPLCLPLPLAPTPATF